MTDAAMDTPRQSSSLYDETDRTKRRNKAEKRFQAYGIAAIAAGIFFLVVLLVAIISNGVDAVPIG